MNADSQMYVKLVNSIEGFQNLSDTFSEKGFLFHVQVNSNVLNVKRELPKTKFFKVVILKKYLENNGLTEEHLLFSDQGDVFWAQLCFSNTWKIQEPYNYLIRNCHSGTVQLVNNLKDYIDPKIFYDTLHRKTLF